MLIQEGDNRKSAFEFSFRIWLFLFVILGNDCFEKPMLDLYTKMFSQKIFWVPSEHM